jgi:hypothetical protein
VDGGYNAPVLVSKGQFIRTLLDDAGLTNKYILNTEFALLWDGATDADFELTKAYFVAQSYASAIAYDLIANIWYDVTGTWGRNNGLLDRSTLAALPAYDAYQFTAGKLQAAILVQPVTSYPGVGGYAFRNAACTSGDCQVWVLWSLDGASHDVTLPATPLRVQDVDGDDQTTSQTQSIGLEPYYIEISTTDDQGPLTSNVAADPNPVAFGQTYTLTATIDDSATGNSLIDRAEYSLNSGVSWTTMQAQDGAFDQEIEVATADITAPATAGDYSICVRGADTSGNTGAADCTLTLTVSDNQGPLTSNVIANPNPVNFGQSLTISANLSDSSRGGSTITSAEYSLDGGTSWSPMSASDGAFNEVSEAVTVATSAPSTHGSYSLCVRGIDSSANTGVQTCIPLLVTDNTGPTASSLVANPNPVDFNQPLTISASLSDSSTGGSNIASAEYSLDGGTTWSPMSASDGAFNEVIETVTASTSAPATLGDYSLCVRGQDSSGNTGAQTCITLAVDDNTGPLVSNLASDPFTVSFSQEITITATINDSTTGGSTIASAQYSLDGGPWIPMSAQNPPFNQVSEAVIASTTAPATQGDYSLCVRGQDASLNIGAPACITLSVYSTMGPRTSDVFADPNPVIFSQPLTITANISDTYTGGLPIAWAEFTLDGGATWTRMEAVDGAFDEVSEAVIDPGDPTFAPDIRGTYNLCVRGADTSNNIGPQVCTTLQVDDDQGPLASNLVADPNPANLGQLLIITANISDTLTGGSTIASAQYSLDSGTWTAMEAQDDAFDEINEVVTATATAPATLGNYSLCVRGQDSSGNTGAPTCITLSVDDNSGPTTSDVVANPNPAEFSQAITITANIDDSSTGDSTIASAQYSLDGGTSWSPMSAQDGGFDEAAEAVTASTNAPSLHGDYNLCVRGIDNSGNTGTVVCITLVVTDNVGPQASNLVADPNPVGVDQPLTISATVDDSATGGSTIASAQYSMDGGAWTAMAAQDGAFDEVSEAVTISTSAPTSDGSYNLCVRGTDNNGNTGAQICTTLSVESGTHSIMLPMIYTPIPRNGYFEQGINYWDPHSELIPVSTVTASPINPITGSPDNFIPVSASSALLGNVGYPCSVDGLPYGPDVYAGLDQTVDLPLTSNLGLVFKYIIYSQDASTSDEYDRFEVYVNDELKFHDGNQVNSGLNCNIWWRVPSPQNPGNNGEIDGWATGTINLSAYAGQTVTISFRNYSRFDGWYNTYTYLDDVAIINLDS